MQLLALRPGKISSFRDSDFGRYALKKIAIKQVSAFYLTQSWRQIKGVSLQTTQCRINQGTRPA
ncbi:MAG: hypothetical protein WD767_11215 [Alphaproteobacteria bacterium]